MFTALLNIKSKTMNKKETNNFLLFARFYHLMDKPVAEVAQIYNNNTAASMAVNITGHNYV